jgi:hypothetical protein
MQSCPCTGVLVSPYPDLLPDVFCLMVRIFRLMLVLLYIYIYIYTYIYIEFLATDTEVPGSIPGATRFSE